MKINTKYNIKDKVWYYIDYLNKYSWGKVDGLNVKMGRNEIGVVEYHIKNRHYDENYWRFSLGCYSYREQKPWSRTSELITFKEEEIFETKEDLIEDLEKKHRVKMGECIELKKGWFK